MSYRQELGQIIRKHRKAEIDKKYVLAFFESRNEAEVVVNPAYLQNITESENMENDFSIHM